MLLAVEGGGFFSSSASGYSKGLTVLLLNQKNQEKHMRVSPWNHYQLVDQESDPDLQLASGKNRLVHGCASFVCFGRTAAGLESPSPLKVGPNQKQDILPDPPVCSKDEEIVDTTDRVEEEDNSSKFVALRSSLKRRTTSIPVSVALRNECESLCGNGSNGPAHPEKRKVQWTDVSGGELTKIREFEPRDIMKMCAFGLLAINLIRILLIYVLVENSGSDDEFDNSNERTCSCSIM